MATAFAVFCATDGSLTFYNRDSVPAAGDTIEGKIVSNVYTGFDTTNYSKSSSVPWYSQRTSIISVSFMSEFATVKPISTSHWFYGATNMTSFDCTNLDTSDVTNMSNMFYSCKSLTSLDVSNFDTSNVTNMSNIFYACHALTSLDVSNFNTSNVTDMNSMFSNCRTLTSLDVSNFNTSKVTNMASMFSGCQALTILDLSNFDTSKVTNMNSMFANCRALKTIYVLDTWSTDSVTSSMIMFYDCNNLVGAIPYSNTKTTSEYANYITGYLTDKAVYMLIRDVTLYKLADKIRVLNASEDDITPANMIEIISNILDAREVKF